MTIGPVCPQCDAPVPFGRTQWSLGRVFSCRGCDATLVISRGRAGLQGILMFTTFWLVRDRFPAEWGGQVGLFVLIVAVALPLTWVTTRVRLASAS